MTSASPLSPDDSESSLFLNTNPELSINDPINKILNLPQSSLFQGMSMSLSGKFPPLTQQQMRTLLRKHGAQVSATPRKKTQYIVCGEKCANAFPEWCICVNKEWVFDSIEKGQIIDTRSVDHYIVPTDISRTIASTMDAPPQKAQKRKRHVHNMERVSTLLKIDVSELDKLFKFPGNQHGPVSGSDNGMVSSSAIVSSSEVAAGSGTSPASGMASNTSQAGHVTNPNTVSNDMANTSEMSSEAINKVEMKNSLQGEKTDRVRNPEIVDYQKRIMYVVPYSYRMRYADPYADLGDAEVLFYDQAWSEMYCRMCVRENTLERGDPDKGIFHQPAFLSKEVYDEYYLLQILVFFEGGIPKYYIVHNRWGVVGQGHSGVWQKAFKSYADAIAFYKLIHLKLTDNDFSESTFKPRKNCFVPLSFEIPPELMEKRRAEERRKVEQMRYEEAHPDKEEANHSDTQQSGNGEGDTTQSLKEIKPNQAPQQSTSEVNNEVNKDVKSAINGTKTGSTPENKSNNDIGSTGTETASHSNIKPETETVKNTTEDSKSSITQNSSNLQPSTVQSQSVGNSNTKLSSPEDDGEMEIEDDDNEER